MDRGNSYRSICGPPTLALTLSVEGGLRLSCALWVPGRVCENRTFVAPLRSTKDAFLEQEIGRVPLPEEDGLDQGPHLLITPVFTQCVTGV